MSSTSADGLAFTDTNVLVYAYDRDAGDKHGRARAIVEDLLEARRGCVSIQVLQELFVTLTRKLPRAFDGRAARAVVEAFAAWKLHAPQAGDLLAAIDLADRHRISFWDAMIVRSAIVLGCETLYTEDLNAGQRFDGVLVVNPFAA
jgi:predicted nucleic acid-binding protein